MDSMTTKSANVSSSAVDAKVSSRAGCSMTKLISNCYQMDILDVDTSSMDEEGLRKIMVSCSRSVMSSRH